MRTIATLPEVVGFYAASLLKSAWIALGPSGALSIQIAMQLWIAPPSSYARWFPSASSRGLDSFVGRPTTMLVGQIRKFRWRLARDRNERSAGETSLAAFAASEKEELKPVPEPERRNGTM